MGFRRESKTNRSERGSQSGEKTERPNRERTNNSERSSTSSSYGNKQFPFTNVGSVKQGRNLSDKDSKELKGCKESLKIKLYMPNIPKLVLGNGATIGINLGKRDSDKDYVLGQVVIPIGSLTATQKTAEDLVSFLKGMGTIAEFDFVVQVYLPRGIETVSFEDGKTLLLTFRTGDKAEDLDFVLGTLSIANDNTEG